MGENIDTGKVGEIETESKIFRVFSNSLREEYVDS